MKYLKYALIAMLALVLTACSGCSMTGVNESGESVDLTQAQKIDLVCTGVTAAVKAATYADAAGKLTADTRAKILEATEITDPVCSAKPYPTLDEVKLTAFEKAAEVLRGVVLKL
jgi:hypothetical protein